MQKHCVVLMIRKQLYIYIYGKRENFITEQRNDIHAKQMDTLLNLCLHSRTIISLRMHVDVHFFLLIHIQAHSKLKYRMKERKQKLEIAFPSA